MNAFGIDGKYESISQRVAATYRRMLTAFCPVLPDGIAPEKQAAAAAAQADLHAFFTALYDALLANPGLFGLPLTEDIFLLSDHGTEGPNKTDVKRLLDRPRKLMDEGLLFLRSAGAKGRLSGQALVLDPGNPAAALLQKKSGRAWISGLERAGVSVIDAGGSILLTSERFPQMIAALQPFAQACEACPNPSLGMVFFARCDFRALRQDFSVDPLELYHTFGAQDCARAVEMHAFFTGRGYQPAVTLEHMHQWDVRYQGKKSVKASPLFQVIFDERLLRPMRSQIKIASAPRIVTQLAKYSSSLQDDFANRTYPCHDCGWCSSKKGLQHPMLFTHNGSERKICWYVNPDIDDLNAESIALVKEYTRLHEELEA